MNMWKSIWCSPPSLTGHPVDISPLAKRMPQNPDYTERFELFVAGP